jgi:hypothetical protein
LGGGGSTVLNVKFCAGFSPCKFYGMKFYNITILVITLEELEFNLGGSKKTILCTVSIFWVTKDLCLSSFRNYLG